MLLRNSLTGLVLLAVVACSDSTGPSELSLAQLAGAWNLTRTEMVLASDTSVRVDNTQGLEAGLTISENGAATLTLHFGGTSSIIEGTIAVRGDTVFYEPEGSDTYVAIVKLAGQTMTWRSVATYLIDLDGDGTPEPAYEWDVWHRG